MKGTEKLVVKGLTEHNLTNTTSKPLSNYVLPETATMQQVRDQVF